MNAPKSNYAVPLLSDGVLRLRAPEPEDVDTMYIWENDPVLWPFGTATAPLSRQVLVEYIDNYDGDIFSAKQLRLIVEMEETGEPIGTIDITNFDPRDRHARIGIFIAPQMRCRGFGSRVLSLVLPWAGGTLGIHTLIALAACDNDASRALFSKAGFRTCGRLRSFLRRGNSYCDIILYQVIL